MKRLFPLLMGVVAITFCVLYLREKNKPPREIKRILERRIEVPKEIIEEVPVEQIVEKEVKVPVEVIKEVPAAIPPEYIEALAVSRLLDAARPVSDYESLEGVTDVSVAIAGNGLDITDGTVSPERLKTRAELKLRQLGVPIREDSRWILAIFVIVTRDPVSGGVQAGWSFSVTPQLRERGVYLPRSGKWFVATDSIYNGIMSVASCGTLEINQSITDTVDSDLAEFANSWSMANRN